MLVNTNRISVRNWFTEQVKKHGASYVRLYSNKATTHPKAVLGYRMKYYAVKRDCTCNNVPLREVVELINNRARLIGLPYRLELERVYAAFKPHTNLRIVPATV